MLLTILPVITLCVCGGRDLFVSVIIRYRLRLTMVLLYYATHAFSRCHSDCIRFAKIRNDSGDPSDSRSHSTMKKTISDC